MPHLKLETDRLLLRSYLIDDIPSLIRLAGAREVAATTLRIPHPYTEQNARDYVATCQLEAAAGPVTRFAITLRNTGEFVGGIGFRLETDHHRGELGYWIGVPSWGHGYATEAAHVMLDYGFDVLALHRIYASHVAGNTASGRVLTKIGMKYEGRMRSHICKWDEFQDLDCYGVLRSDHDPGQH